jgi:hypothetical protein
MKVIGEVSSKIGILRSEVGVSFSPSSSFCFFSFLLLKIRKKSTADASIGLPVILFHAWLQSRSACDRPRQPKET